MNPVRGTIMAVHGIVALAIELTEQGFAVTPRLHHGLGTWAVARDASGSGIFQKDGRPW